MKLYLIHSDEVLETGIARFSIAYWRKQSSEKIIESLKKGQSESLKVKLDGRILNGNVRCKVLDERGFDLDKLEVEIL
jgi:hypothetical protein